MTKNPHSFNIAVPLFLLVCAVCLPVGSAEARPSTQSYTCEGVKDFVDQQGTVVMNTKRSDIYRKFYSRSYECPFTQVHTAYRVPTKSGRCTLYICRPPKELFFK